MKQRLAVAIPVDESELGALARQRAEQVRDHLIEVGQLTEERVFLLETDPTASGNEQVRSLLTITAGSRETGRENRNNERGETRKESGTD